MTFSRLAKEVLVEVLVEKSIIQKEVMNIIKEEGENWMLPVQEYLLFGLLPKDPQKARKLRVKAPQYRIINGNLYRNSYLSPWLRCVGLIQAKSIIQEIHQGSCGMHASAKKAKARHDIHNFDVAFFPMRNRYRKTFTNGSGRCKESIWRSLYGSTSYANSKSHKSSSLIMGNNSPKESSQSFAKDLASTSPSPRLIILKKMDSNEETPFSLTYGSEAFIPIEISMETERVKEFEARKNDKRHQEDLDILKERGEIAFIREAHYKQKLERYYNKHVWPSTFKPGTYVLRLNNASKDEFQ
ncbi:hypothetical protein Tco_0005597 [Tanacetum coccineum]